MKLPQIIGEVIIFGVLIGWSAYWGMVTYLNFSVGDVVGAATTFVLFVLMAVALLLWRIRELVPAQFTT